MLNALAAAAAGLALGLEPEAIATGLGRVVPVAGRLNWIGTGSGARVLDDSANANPTSLRAALEVLRGAGKPPAGAGRHARELGGNAAALHAEATCRSAHALGIDRSLHAGRLGALRRREFQGGARHFDTVEALVEALRSHSWASMAPGQNCRCWRMGSAPSRMERVVAALTGRVDAEGAH